VEEVEEVEEVAEVEEVEVLAAAPLSVNASSCSPCCFLDAANVVARTRCGPSVKNNPATMEEMTLNKEQPIKTCAVCLKKRKREKQKNRKKEKKKSSQ